MNNKLWKNGFARLVRLLCLLCSLNGVSSQFSPALAQQVASQDAHFDVLEFRVNGVTKLSALQVEQAVTPYLGLNKTIEDVQNASEALEKTYHDAGYLTVLVSIPPQKVEDGIVRLLATEASVSRLRVVGSHYYSLGQIRDAAPELAEGQVPNFAVVQDELGALNHSPDRHVTPVLRPGKESGTVEVDLNVEDQLPFHGEADINNRYSQFGSPNHASATLHWDNLWGQQHSIGLTLQTVVANPQESSVASVNYTWPLQGADTLALYMVRSNSNVTYSGLTNVLGTGNIYGARYVDVLPGYNGFSHSATFGVDYKSFGQSVSLVNAGGFNTPIDYLPWIAEWDGTWTGVQSVSRLGASFNFHMSHLVGSDQQFADKRYRGLANYFYIKGSASRNATDDSGWGFNLRSTWQLATQALISNEQFSIGGADTVRGYLESSAMGDLGLAASVELTTPNLMGYATANSLSDLRLLAFIDAGTVEVLYPLTDGDQYNISSTGVGLRLKGARGLSLELDFATALTDLSTVGVHSGDAMVHFKLAYEW